MKIVALEKVRALLFPPAAPTAASADRSVYERIPIPHTFKPRLSLIEALIAVAGAFLRIFLGSLLFAVWGTYTLLACSKIKGHLWRAIAVVPLVVLFLLTFAALMLAISAMVRTLSPKRP